MHKSLKSYVEHLDGEDKYAPYCACLPGQLVGIEKHILVVLYFRRKKPYTGGSKSAENSGDGDRYGKYKEGNIRTNILKYSLPPPQLM